MARDLPRRSMASRKRQGEELGRVGGQGPTSIGRDEGWTGSGKIRVGLLSRREETPRLRQRITVDPSSWVDLKVIFESMPPLACTLEITSPSVNQPIQPGVQTL